jgi:hypothetical protein
MKKDAANKRKSKPGDDLRTALDISPSGALLLQDEKLGAINHKEDHVIHPVHFLRKEIAVMEANDDMEKDVMQPDKVYVSVKAVFYPDGGFKPTLDFLEDGCDYPSSKSPIFAVLPVSKPVAQASVILVE